MVHIAATAGRSAHPAGVGAAVGPLIGDLLLLSPFVALIGTVIGSIYLGWATPTEAAAIGVFAAALIGALFGELDLRGVLKAIQATVRVSGALLVIIAMAQTLSYALSVGGIPTQLSAFVVGLGLQPPAFLLVLIALYTVLGCIMDGVAMTMITIPVLFPVVRSLGIDPVFFGIILVVMMELGLITPPFGLNLFVIQQISGEPMGAVLKGSMPYCIIILAFVGLLLVFPGLVVGTG
jgi:tripartite ATP-independent transporter DctM subunit